jgi:hypothetical protein
MKSGTPEALASTQQTGMLHRNGSPCRRRGAGIARRPTSSLILVFHGALGRSRLPHDHTCPDYHARDISSSAGVPSCTGSIPPWRAGAISAG